MPKTSRRRHPRKNADLERTARHEPVATRQGPAFRAPVSLRFDHFRCRLADPDGLSAKAAIDGLVHCGILRDDSAKEITEIRHFQHKVAKPSDEKTIITITLDSTE